MTTKTPHVHAELIKAWADGAKIQLCGETTGTWYDCTPSWEPHSQYRIKPEPKPDIVMYSRASCINCSSTYWARKRSNFDNIKALFDGETLALKSVEMIK